MEIWEPKPPGTLWATSGLLRDSYGAKVLGHSSGVCSVHIVAYGVPVS